MKLAVFLSVAALAALRRAGIHVSIDDFGTGDDGVPGAQGQHSESREDDDLAKTLLEGDGPVGLIVDFILRHQLELGACRVAAAGRR